MRASALLAPMLVPARSNWLQKQLIADAQKLVMYDVIRMMEDADWPLTLTGNH